jgi:hypothetical protein
MMYHSLLDCTFFRTKRGLEAFFLSALIMNTHKEFPLSGQQIPCSDGTLFRRFSLLVTIFSANFYATLSGG